MMKPWMKWAAGAVIIGFIALMIFAVTGAGDLTDSFGNFIHRERTLADAVFDGSLVIAVAIVIHAWWGD